ncbi:MAG: hypothetical protein QW385_07335 [Thermoproteota archaeon]
MFQSILTLQCSKLVASIEQRIMLEKALGQVKVNPDWDLTGIPLILTWSNPISDILE